MKINDLSIVIGETFSKDVLVFFNVIAWKLCVLFKVMASKEIYQNLKRCIVNLKISRSTKNTKVDYYQLLEKE